MENEETKFNLVAKLTPVDEEQGIGYETHVVPTAMASDGQPYDNGMMDQYTDGPGGEAYLAHLLEKRAVLQPTERKDQFQEDEEEWMEGEGNERFE